MISGRPLSGNARKTISILDRMKDIGLSKYVNLPRIVLCGKKESKVGEQSSGKTSLIESIIGLEFMGAGVRTGRPIELKLQHCPGLLEIEWIFEAEPDKKYKDIKEVAKRIEQEQPKLNTILIQPLKLTSIAFLQTKVCLNQCPELTFIDLPGICRTTSQTGEDFDKITAQLLAKYCAQDPRAIIFCVIPANIDLSTSRALYLAKCWDPTGDRTLATLTKIDLMDEGTSAWEVLSNRLIPLKHGYCAVKCRSKQDFVDGVTLNQALANQVKFFKGHEAYQTLAHKREILGIPALTIKINELVYSCVKSNLPLIARELKSGIQAQQIILNNLGPPLPSEIDQKLVLLYSLISKACSRFRDQMRGRQHQSQPTQQSNYSAGIIVKMLFRELYSDKFSRKQPFLSQLSDQQIDRIIRTHQGSSVPGFPSLDAFTYLLTPLLDSLHSPFLQLLSQIHTFVDRLFEERREFTLKVIEGNLECEGNYILTNDGHYQEKRTRLIPEQPEGMNLEENKGRKLQAPEERERLRKQKVFIHQMRLRVEHYYRVVLRNMRDIIPKNIGHLFCQYIVNNMELYVYQAMILKKEFIQRLGEPKHVAEQRKKAQQTLDILKRALYFVKGEIAGVKLI